jgi:hypothetical protein
MAAITELVNPYATAGRSPNSGRLQNLYKNQYARNIYQYPRDVSTTAKGHTVLFNITERKVVSGLANAFNEDGVGGVASFFLDETSKVGTQINNNINNSGGSLSNVTTRTNDFVSDTITLYMPETSSFGTQAQYGQLSIADAAGSLPGIGKAFNALTSTLNNGAARLVGNAVGYVFNPQQQLLFEGIDFRDYSMTFTFTPFSSYESEAMINIIKTFRRHAAPTIVTGLNGFFFNPPSVFDVKFLFNGGENFSINKVKTSVLTNVDVNYAPNGWSTHEDGTPIQTTMTLQFRELELVDRTAIDSGY